MDVPRTHERRRSTGCSNRDPDICPRSLPSPPKCMRPCAGRHILSKGIRVAHLIRNGAAVEPALDHGRSHQPSAISQATEIALRLACTSSHPSQHKNNLGSDGGKIVRARVMCQGLRLTGGAPVSAPSRGVGHPSSTKPACCMGCCLRWAALPTGTPAAMSDRQR